MSVLIKVVEGHHMPESRSNGDKVFWTQKVYFDNGGPFPSPCKLSIPDISKAVPPGNYRIASGAYQAGKFGDLEINRFELYRYLEPVVAQPAKVKA